MADVVPVADRELVDDDDNVWDDDVVFDGVAEDDADCDGVMEAVGVMLATSTRRRPLKVRDDITPSLSSQLLLANLMPLVNVGSGTIIVTAK